MHEPARSFLRYKIKKEADETSAAQIDTAAISYYFYLRYPPWNEWLSSQALTGISESD
jgi:hypothetical protein